MSERRLFDIGGVCVRTVPIIALLSFFLVLFSWRIIRSRLLRNYSLGSIRIWTYQVTISMLGVDQSIE